MIAVLQYIKMIVTMCTKGMLFICWVSHNSHYSSDDSCMDGAIRSG